MAPSGTVYVANDAGPSTPANNTHHLWWKDAGLRRLNMHLAVLMLGSFVCGYDGSLMNGFFGLATYLRDMDNPDANKSGLLTAAISLGYLIGFLPASWLGDKYGRKGPQLFGAAVVVASVFVQAFAIGGWKFFGGRILLGFGAAFPLTAGSAHLFELAHPRQAAQLATLFGAVYWVGSVTASWVTFGTSYLASNWSWRIPTLLQGFASAIQLAFLWWAPESPRWLMAQGRTEEAHAILAKYHANGDRDDDLVLSEIAQIQTALDLEKEASAFSYLEFFRTKGNLKRLFIVVYIGIFTQLLGNALISYYLVPMLASIGVTSTVQQQGINGGLQIFNLATSVFYVVFVLNRTSRRSLWLFSTGGVLVFFSLITATTAIYARNPSPSAGRATVAFIFLYSGCYNAAWSVQFYSYVLEILPYRMRTKGMAICLLVDYAALFLSQYANPPALDAMGWRYYTIYIAINAVTLLVVYFTFPETANLTLEQSAALLDGDTAQQKLDEAARTAVDTCKKDDDISV